ncbi:MAG: hypothetical protein L7V85_05870 [Bacteroidia bacterium]|nr:hypothetical protein [Bacteroidia bacterium]
MAVATGTAIALAAGVGAVAGGAQAIGGAVRAKRARKDMDNYQRQEVTDLAQGLRISTLGGETQIEGAEQTQATQVDALQAGGARTVLGGIQAVGAQKLAVEQAVAAGFDQKMATLSQQKYGEKVRQFGVVEGRQNQEIAGMANELQAGRAAIQQGLGTIAGTAMSTVGSLANMPK